MSIEYSATRTLTPAEFRSVLQRSTLGERRPIDDPDCMAGMLLHADLLCTAWEGPLLVGVARSITDFVYCCYLSDLAVDRDYQRRGIGRQLVRTTRQRLGPGCSLILLAAPQAVDYYPRIGFDRHPSAWVLKPGESMD